MSVPSIGWQELASIGAAAAAVFAGLIFVLEARRHWLDGRNRKRQRKLKDALGDALENLRKADTKDAAEAWQFAVACLIEDALDKGERRIWEASLPRFGPPDNMSRPTERGEWLDVVIAATYGLIVRVDSLEVHGKVQEWTMPSGRST